MKLKIAAIQMSIAPSNPKLNLEKMESYIARSATQGADLVVFPEDAVTGPLAGQTAFLSESANFLEIFKGLAQKYKIDIVPGSWVTQVGELLYNTTHYINWDGTVAGAYHKINLWETEKKLITPGVNVSVFPTRFGLVGLSICWDIAFPLLFSEMARLGAKLLISPTYWSFTKKADGDEDVADDEILLIDSLCTARSFENDAVLVYCNGAGELELEGENAVLSGRTQIVHPHEKVVAKCEENEEELIIASVTLT